MKKESVFKQLVESTMKGEHFSINLNSKTIRINNKEILLSEKCPNWITEEDMKIYNSASKLVKEKKYWTIAEFFYYQYKRSSPRKITLGNKPYFKALDIDELNDGDIAYGVNRNVAQAILEGYILCASLQGWLTMPEPEKNYWFYQGNDKEFVVLKEWIDD